MNPDNLTEAVTQAISQAQQIAATRKQQNITVAHLFKFLVQPGELAREISSQLGLKLDDVNAELDKEIDQIATVEGSNVSYGQSLSSNLYELLQDAEQIKNEFGDTYIAVDTLTIAVMQLHGDKFADYLSAQGITEQKVRNVVEKIRGGQKVTTKNQEDSYQSLEKYGTDLVQAARDHKLGPIIGRDEEIWM